WHRGKKPSSIVRPASAGSHHRRAPDDQEELGKNPPRDAGLCRRLGIWYKGSVMRAADRAHLYKATRLRRPWPPAGTRDGNPFSAAPVREGPPMSWYRALRRPLGARPFRAFRYRPNLDPLEDRLALAVFMVIDAGDAGNGNGPIGDLRYCITQANATPAFDVIQFRIQGAGTQTINLTAPLPAITAPVLIDGYTQPGAQPANPAAGIAAVLAVELNGAGAKQGASGLTIMAGGSTVRG